MTPDADRLRRVRELFDVMFDLPAAQRRAALEASAAGDPALVREVAALLEEAERTEPGLASRLEGQDLTGGGDPAALVGQRLGAYEVVRLIGLGGMGAVYEGQRAADQYRMRVAIKLVRHELNLPPTLARFRRERRILARLQHPNIATLLDGGVGPDGRPFLVMEYVEGEPITTWCDRRGLSLARRLALFRQVCAAVQHAHRNLVIHRDLKPGNILVTPDGEVKLLDFGVAQLLGAEAEEEMPLTRGGMRAFTPEYASPEQIRGETLTTASDVYSLGVVLYELLAGRRPHLATGSVASIERSVLEDPIPRPSAVAGEGAATRCGERDAARLRRRLAGELDSIVMLALRPEPERRWASVEALSDDLLRHLDGRPVSAQDDWFGYRAGKFLRRNRAATAATALLLIALVVGAVATGIEAGRARLAQLKAEKVSDFLEVLLQSVRPTTGGRDVTVSEVLDAASRRLGAETVDDPEVRAELEGVIGQSEEAIGRLDEAQRHFRIAVQVDEQVYGHRSLPVVEAMTYVARAHLARGELDQADSVVTECLVLHRAISARPDTLYASLLGMRGSIANSRGDAAAAERAHREALGIRLRLLGPHAELVAASMNNLAVALGNQGRWAPAESLERASLAIRRLHDPPPSIEVADTENALATALDLQGKYAEAESLYADVLAVRGRLLGREHPDYAFTLMNYAGFEFDRGRYALATDLSRQVLALRGRSLPESHPAIAAALQTLGRGLDRLGRHEEAGRMLTESLALRRRYLGPDSWLVASAEGQLGEHDTQVRDFPRAERLLLDADAIFTRSLGPGHARTVQNLRRMAALYDAWARSGSAAEVRARIPAPAP